MSATPDAPPLDDHGHRCITWEEARRLAGRIALRLMPAGEYGFDHEDLMQVGLLGVWRALGDSDPLPAGSPLVGAILQRRMLDELRVRGWSRRSALHPLVLHLGAAVSEGSDGGGDWAARLPGAADVEGAALDRLTLAEVAGRGDRAARMALAYGAGWGMREIGMAHGVSEFRVSQLIGEVRDAHGPGRPTPAQAEQRALDAEVARLRAAGLRTSAIGAALGMSTAMAQTRLRRHLRRTREVA